MILTKDGNQMLSELPKKDVEARLEELFTCSVGFVVRKDPRLLNNILTTLISENNEYILGIAKWNDLSVRNTRFHDLVLLYKMYTELKKHLVNEGTYLTVNTGHNIMQDIVKHTEKIYINNY